MKKTFTRIIVLFINLKNSKQTFLLVAFCAFCLSTSAQYCTPGGSYSACALTNDFWITDVSFTGTGSTFNYTGGTCVSNSPFYLNTGYTGDVVPGNTYTLSISRPGGRYKEYVNVWVDWDNNNALNDNSPYVENIAANLLFAKNAANTITTSVTVPVGVAPGIHRMRVRIQYNNTNANDPCYSTMTFNNQTETKDFNLNIAGGCVAPVVTGSASASTVCAGDTVILKGSGATTYAWSNGVTDSAAFFPTNTTTYTVTGTTSGCSGTSTVTVTVNPLPVISAGSDVSVCTNDSTQLNVTGDPVGSSYLWSPATGLSCTGCKNPEVVPLSSQAYIVKVTDLSGCIARDTVDVNIVTVSALAGPDTIVCNGSFLQLEASGGTTYQWSPGTGLSDSTAANPSTAILSNTTYTVTVSTGSCSSTATVAVNSFPALPVPTITQSNDTLFCSTNPVYTSYQWYDDATLIPGATDTFLVIAQNGDYDVQVSDENGCRTTVVASIVLGVESLNPYGTGNNSITLSPNPASNQLTIHSSALQANESGVVSVMNVLGETLQQEKIKGNSDVNINIKTLPVGIYFLQLRSANSNITKRFVKE